MRTSPLLLILLAVVTAAMLVVAGCTTTPPSNQTTVPTTSPDGNETPALTPSDTVTEPNTTVPNETQEAENITAPIVNSTWRWIAGVGDEPVQVSNPSRYTIAFDANGTYAVRADCNTGRGNFTVENATLAISPATLTDVYCGDASLDKTYLESLERVTSWQFDARGRLLLIQGTAFDRLVFEKAP
ncbi:MAG: META domain-containing protein [Methanospirillum sp.]|nr:META domain-containing protein [Methanospirillum sp.]